MTDFFSYDNHDNANTFLLVLISLTLLGCIVFYFYKRKQNKDNNKYSDLINKQNNKFIESTGFISF